MFSSLDNTAGSDYVTHTAAAKLGWTFFWGLTFRSTFNYIGYTGLDTGTEDYFLWNLSLGKKFLKNRSLRRTETKSGLYTSHRQQLL